MRTVQMSIKSKCNIIQLNIKRNEMLLYAATWMNLTLLCWYVKEDILHNCIGMKLWNRQHQSTKIERRSWFPTLLYLVLRGFPGYGSFRVRPSTVFRKAKQMVNISGWFDSKDWLGRSTREPLGDKRNVLYFDFGGSNAGVFICQS